MAGIGEAVSIFADVQRSMDLLLFCLPHRLSDKYARKDIQRLSQSTMTLHNTFKEIAALSKEDPKSGIRCSWSESVAADKLRVPRPSTSPGEPGVFEATLPCNYDA